MSISISARPGRTVLRASRLFDGVSSALLPDHAVVLEGRTIVAVDRAAAMPMDCDVVELTGSTLMPGMIDTHVHLAFDAGPDAAAQLSDNEVTAAIRRAGQTALRGGVTTVRDLGDRGYLSLALRSREGMPTIVAAGPPITAPTTEDVRAAVREHVERGCDVIKIMASGFSAMDLMDAVDEAHRHGLPITAHAVDPRSVEDAVAAGVDGLEHVPFSTRDRIKAIADRRVVVGAGLGVKGPMPGLPLSNLRAMYEAGVPIVPATDAGIDPGKPHDVLPYAVPQLRAIGMSPAESLRAITSVGASVCGLAHQKGRLAPGFDADVIAVDGDPLTDPAALHKIRAVYAHGVRYV